MLIRITWEDADQPSVLVPFGDFFGLGHGMPGSYNSVPFVVSSRPQEEGIFAGVSTGASLQVAIRVCKRLPVGSKVVALSPDGGWKYLSTGAYAPGDVKEIATAISGTLWA